MRVMSKSVAEKLAGQACESSLLPQVAEICVDALSEPAATNKVVEIVADQNEIVRPAAELFANVS